MEYVFFLRKMHEVDVIQASPVGPFILLKRNYTKFVEATPFLELYSAVFHSIPPNLFQTFRLSPPCLSPACSPFPAPSPLPFGIGDLMVLLPPFSAQPFPSKYKRKEETRSPLIQTGSGFSLHLHFLAGGVGG